MVVNIETGKVQENLNLSPDVDMGPGKFDEC